MSSQGKRSKRFTPTKWMERLVPALLVLLLVALVVTVLIVVLSVVGLMPAL
jgi:hypothetical protein